jgi:hypothetical protein
MAASPSPALTTAAQAHFHFGGQTCPYCDQLIPEDKLEEISGRIEARARERLAEETERLREQYARERAQAEARAEFDQFKKDAAAQTEKVRSESTAREAQIREEASKMATEAAREQIAEAQKARTEAEQAREGLSNQLDELRAQNAETIEKLTRNAAAREKAIREEATATAEDAVRVKLATAEGAKAEAEEARATLAAQLEAARADNSSIVERITREAAAQEKAIREEATKAAEAGAAEKIAAADTAKAEAERKRLAAEAALAEKLAERGREIETLKEAHAGEINAQREALEKDKIATVNAERGGFLKVRMKLEEDLADMQRRLQQKTAHEHGEGAELDLYEVLKAALEGDRIRRVGKGSPGADVIHEVIEEGEVVGKMVYDSKNRGNWMGEYAVKLRKDQIAEKADFAILSTNKFPKDRRELCTFENVILACPARVLALAEILRGQIVVNHELRVGSVEREKKTAALYEFINSPLCGQLLDSVQSLVGKIEQVDIEEQSAHHKTWDKRATLRQAILKANGDFRFQIRRIVGTADAEE